MSSTSDRLDRLERALPPQEAVLVWLSEAHAHGSLITYLRATIDLPPQEAPLERIIARITAYERGRHAGRSRQEVDTAIEQGFREAVFRYELINAIEAETTTFIDRVDSLMDLMYLRTVGDVLECRTVGDGRGCLSRHRVPRVAGLAVERFRQEQEARQWLQDRYLAGRSALFLDTADRWQRVADTAAAITELIDTAPACTADEQPTPGPGIDDAGDYVERRAGGLSDIALVAMHRFFGEDDEAFAMVRRRILASG